MQTVPSELLPPDAVPRLGLVVLQSDLTVEDELRDYYRDLELSLLVNRIPFADEVNAGTLKAMEDDLEACVNLFPVAAEFDCLGYGCTSGALHIGSERVAELAAGVRPVAAATDPMRAAQAALERLGARRVAYLAPYVPAVSQAMVDAFREAGIDVVRAATFNVAEDRNAGRITPASIGAAATTLAAGGDVDAVFVACTSLKCARVIPAVEADTGVTMISSNQVLAWHMAELAGVTGHVVGRGRLFEQ